MSTGAGGRPETATVMFTDLVGQAQLYVRLTTENFEEAVRARQQKRAPVFRD